MVYQQRYGPINPNERMEWMVATLITITVNMWKAADADPVEPEQFVPKFGAAKQEEPEEPQSAEKMLSIIEKWNAALGGVDLREKKDV